MIKYLEKLPVSLGGDYLGKFWRAVHAGVNPFGKRTKKE